MEIVTSVDVPSEEDRPIGPYRVPVTFDRLPLNWSEVIFYDTIVYRTRLIVLV